MSQNMPLLSGVLGTAALTSVIVVLLMSYQWGRAAEPLVTQVIRRRRSDLRHAEDVSRRLTSF